MPRREEFVAAANLKPPRRAPYTFVPINDRVLPSPVGSRLSHDRPLRDGLCGELQVTWTVETPVLVGGRSNDEPVQLGENGPWILPGSSLRGMIRSVLEIAAYARLNFIDDNRFALRDYENWTWQKKAAGREIRAGWLQKRNEEYFLTPILSAAEPSGWKRVRISDLCAALGISTDNNCIDWHCLSLHDRMQAISSSGLGGVIDLARVGVRGGGKGTLVVAGQVKTEVERRRPHSPVQPTRKTWEAAFLAGDDEKPARINADAAQAFDVVQPVDGRRHEGNPDANWSNWSYWKPRLRDGERVPVYFVGDPGAAQTARPPASAFFMSLTRLMRAPFDRTIYDVAAVTQPVGRPHGLDPLELDLVEALFGWMPPVKAETPPLQRRGRELAWRSRVFFRHAVLVEGDPEPFVRQRGVTMQPRASFYPFYLRSRAESAARHPVDYDNADARLAGRKRYPARNRHGDLPPSPRADAADQNVDIRFLNASRNAPLTFQSRIRVHNITEIELGSLIWALTFGCHGKQDAHFRHMLGRAKSFGFGQVCGRVTAAMFDRNDGDSPPTPDGAMAAFESWAVTELAARNMDRPARFAELPEIRALLASAHAPTGQNLNEHLQFTEGPGANAAERTLKGYQLLRQRSGHAPGVRATFGYAGRDAPAVAKDGDDSYIALPGYPWDEVP